MCEVESRAVAEDAEEEDVEQNVQVNTSSCAVALHSHWFSVVTPLYRVCFDGVVMNLTRL